jgi:hypothetical protein
MRSICFDLVQHLGGTEGWGSEQGNRVQRALQAQIASCSQTSLICVSLAGLVRADVSFCRSSVIEVAYRERRKHGLYLAHLNDADLLENWHAAAWMANQPLFAVGVSGSPCRLLGPQPSAGLRAMFEYVRSVPVARTSEAAAALHLKTSNASNKLYQLWQEGYVLRRGRSADSGGIEFEYVRMT